MVAAETRIELFVLLLLALDCLACWGPCQALPTIVSQAVDAIIDHQGAAEQTEVQMQISYCIVCGSIRSCDNGVALYEVPRVQVYIV